jgi:hypothetical protein
MKYIVVILSLVVSVFVHVSYAVSTENSGAVVGVNLPKTMSMSAMPHFDIPDFDRDDPTYKESVGDFCLYSNDDSLDYPQQTLSARINHSTGKVAFSNQDEEANLTIFINASPLIRLGGNPSVDADVLEYEVQVSNKGKIEAKSILCKENNYQVKLIIDKSGKDRRKAAAGNYVAVLSIEARSR